MTWSRVTATPSTCPGCRCRTRVWRVRTASSANGAIRSVLEQSTPLLRRVERLRFSSLSGRSSVAQHDRIIALCEAGDTDGAAAAVRANWQTLAPLLDTLLPEGDRPDGAAGSSPR